MPKHSTRPQRFSDKAPKPKARRESKKVSMLPVEPPKQTHYPVAHLNCQTPVIPHCPTSLVSNETPAPCATSISKKAPLLKKQTSTTAAKQRALLATNANKKHKLAGSRPKFQRTFSENNHLLNRALTLRPLRLVRLSVSVSILTYRQSKSDTMLSTPGMVTNYYRKNQSESDKIEHQYSLAKRLIYSNASHIRRSCNLKTNRPRQSITEKNQRFPGLPAYHPQLKSLLAIPRPQPAPRKPIRLGPPYSSRCFLVVLPLAVPSSRLFNRSPLPPLLLAIYPGLAARFRKFSSPNGSLGYDQARPDSTVHAHFHLSLAAEF